MGKESGYRRNPPRSWKSTAIHWLKESQHYSIPWIRKFVLRLEAATGDAEILALKKELERFLSVLETGGEMARDEVADINRALLMGSLSVTQSGLVAPEEPSQAAPEAAPRPHLPEPRRGRDRGLREPTEAEIRDALRMPDDFGYSGELPIGETWSLGPVIRTRDSNLLDQSNADALEEALGNIPEFSSEYQIVHAGHWAVGWVDHLAFHAVDENREPTHIFKWILGWFDALSDYPVANDDDYSRRQHELLIKDINDAGHRIRDGHPADETGWEEAVREWLEENGSHNARRALEDPENYGMASQDVEAALRALSLFRADEKFAIRLVPFEDDPFMVTVYTTDRQAAIDDQSIEGSNWEAPPDLREAYAIIDNSADLPDRLRTGGYIVDDSEWFWPPAGLPGQEPLRTSEHSLLEWQAPSAHALEIDLKWSLWSADRDTWEEQAPEALAELERAWFTRLPLEIRSDPSKEMRHGRVQLLPNQNMIQVLFYIEWDDPDTLMETIAEEAGILPLTRGQRDIVLNSMTYGPSGSPGVMVSDVIAWPDRAAGTTFDQLLSWVNAVEEELLRENQEAWESLVQRVRNAETGELVEVIASVTVKGNQRAALAAARERGFDVLRENVRVGDSDVTFYVKGSHPALAAWYAESPLAAPFPSGTLLLYRIVDDPHILRALEE
jgi:hypothetical protein